MEAEFSENELEDIMYGYRSDMIRLLKSTATDFLKNHPLIALGLTFALGIALGSILAEPKKD